MFELLWCKGVCLLMGLEQFFENINDFELDELKETIRKIQYEVITRLKELPNYHTSCNRNDDKESTQEEFEMCESAEIITLPQEENSRAGDSYKLNYLNERCLVCGGIVKDIGENF